MGQDHNGQSDESSMMPIEHELTMRLERAHVLAERAQRANGNAQHEINRAREIATALCNEFEPSPRRSRG